MHLLPLRRVGTSRATAAGCGGEHVSFWSSPALAIHACKPRVRCLGVDGQQALRGRVCHRGTPVRRRMRDKPSPASRFLQALQAPWGVALRHARLVRVPRAGGQRLDAVDCMQDVECADFVGGLGQSRATQGSLSGANLFIPKAASGALSMAPIRADAD